MGKVDIIVGHRIYLDTNVFIYALEGIPEWRDLAQSILHLVDEGRCEAIASELTLCECLVKPFKSGRHDFAETYVRFFDPRPGLAVVPVDRTVLVQAADSAPADSLYPTPFMRPRPCNKHASTSSPTMTASAPCPASGLLCSKTLSTLDSIAA